METERKLRFGIMLNAHSIAQWQLNAVLLLLQSGNAELDLLVINGSNKNVSEPYIKKIFRRDSIFRFLIHRHYKVPAEILLPLPKPLNEVDTIVCNPIKANKYSEYFAKEDVQKIASKELDFILRFGFGIIRGDILQSAKYGIWSFHHGDERYFRGGPFAFWEIAKHSPTTGVILQKLTNRLDSGVVLLRRQHKTVFHSWKEMRQRLLDANSDMPLCVVKAIMAKALDPDLIISSTTKARIYHTPSNIKLFLFIINGLISKFKFHIKDLLIHERWRLAYSRQAQKLIDGEKINATFYFPDSNASFLADGFLLKGGDNPVILCEEYIYKNEKGSLCCISNSTKNTALSASYHLAFPYVFKTDTNTFIIPESAESMLLPIYTFDEGTKELKFEQNIMQGYGVIDPALCFHDGFYWLFCGLKGQDPNEKLFLFFSKSIDGPYNPHPLNPIKVNPFGSRSAGNIFTNNGALIRPAQVSIKYYGEFISLQKINILTPYNYAEESVGVIKPEQFGTHFKGLHTISMLDNDVLVDLKKHRFNRADFLRRLRGKLY